MRRTTQRRIFRGIVILAITIIGSAARLSHAANSVVWEPANSLVDTTNFTGVAPYYWFANFNAPNAVTGAPMNQNEVRNLPSWIHLETNPACIGMADDCTTPDATVRTGFSFSENTTTGTGATSTGGQPTYNTLTLPNGATGSSGQAVDTLSGTGNTSSFADVRILAGAPSMFRLWIVTDNGAVAGGVYQDQSRMRTNIRDTGGPPTFGLDGEQTEAEAMPNGVRIGQTDVGHNGIADAWAFLFGDVEEHDLIIVRPTSAAGSRPGFAGIMIQPIPEPSAMVLVALGGVCYAALARRRPYSS